MGCRLVQDAKLSDDLGHRENVLNPAAALGQVSRKVGLQYSHLIIATAHDGRLRKVAT